MVASPILLFLWFPTQSLPKLILLRSRVKLSLSRLSLTVAHHRVRKKAKYFKSTREGLGMASQRQDSSSPPHRSDELESFRRAWKRELSSKPKKSCSYKGGKGECSASKCTEGHNAKELDVRWMSVSSSVSSCLFDDCLLILCWVLHCMYDVSWASLIFILL